MSSSGTRSTATEGADEGTRWDETGEGTKKTRDGTKKRRKAEEDKKKKEDDKKPPVPFWVVPKTMTAVPGEKFRSGEKNRNISVYTIPH